MTVRTRFIRSVITTAQSNTTDLPWARGKTRAEMIARRLDAEQPVRQLKSA
jgi:hypothetical protein